jgi:hypothetical protein
MPESIDRDLSTILGAVTIHSPAGFSFAGEPPVRVAPGPGEADPLARGLRDVLYIRCYARPFGSAPAPAAPGGDPGFPLRLSAANQSRDRWDPEWRIYEVRPDGRLAVQKGERCRSVLPGEYATHAGPGMPPRLGDPVSLLALRESHQLQPGFYYAFGETLADNFDDFRLVRLYFHTSAEGACDLLRHLTARLNRYEVPFGLKCLSDPASYDRTDAAVLYVARRWFQIVAAALADLPAAGLRPAVPLFSRPLRPGVGLAEDPGNGESFGMHRCRLVAEGIVEAWRRGAVSPDDRLGMIQARFAREALSLAKPHLNPGSADFTLGFNLDFNLGLGPGPERIAA